MPYMIPDNFRSRSDLTQAIKRVAGAFAAGLDDDVLVWYEPLFDATDEQPHFVVLDPRLGIVVVEVLQLGGGEEILGGFRGKLRIDMKGREVEVDSPLNRAQRLAAELCERVRAVPSLAHVPVGAVAVLPSLSRQDAVGLGVGSVLNLDVTIFRPDLDQASAADNGEPMLRVFVRACGGELDNELNSNEFDHLRGLIHPEVVVAPRPEQGALFSAASAGGSDVMKVMDRKQEQLARNLGNGHRVIRGVAGSGKTLVLVSRAKLLAKLLPNQKILLTCFTKSLASQLAAQVSEYSNIEVVNLDKMMHQVIKDSGQTHPGYDDGGAAGVSMALAAAQGGKGPRFRAVMIDEGQDFDTEALQFCVELLEATDPDAQDLIIVADSAQNIFRRNFAWKNAGIQAKGRSRILRINYRNTRQIVEFAHRFLTADPAIPIDDVDDGVSVIPAESCERVGPEPTVHFPADLDEEISLIAADVAAAVEASSGRPRSVAVLYGQNAGERPERVVDALREAGHDVLWVTDPKNKKNKELVGQATETVLVSTIQSAKGLEFPHVIVCALGVKDDSTTARKLLYVGFTRAVEELTVVVGAGSPFRSELSATAAQQVQPLVDTTR